MTDEQKARHLLQLAESVAALGAPAGANDAIVRFVNAAESVADLRDKADEVEMKDVADVSGTVPVVTGDVVAMLLLPCTPSSGVPRAVELAKARITPGAERRLRAELLALADSLRQVAESVETPA